MKGNGYMRLVGGLICMMAVCGCRTGNDEDDGTHDGTDDGTWVMPMAFVVQSTGASASTGSSTGSGGWEDPVYDNDTVRALYTDRIQLNVYKRLKGGGYTDEATGFAFDKKVVLTCREPDPADIFYSDHFRYAYASGVVNMQKDYEYRVTALGYAEQKNERTLFSFTDTESAVFSGAEVTLTNTDQYTTPELFFGTPRYGADMKNPDVGDIVFSYESGAINALGGWLYRCVAGIGLTVRKVPPSVKSMTLITGSVNTRCKSTSYEDFKTPEDKVDVAEGDEANRFVLDSWSRPDDWTTVYGVEDEDSINVTMNESNLFPVKSNLYVRIVQEDEDGNDKVTVVPLRMKKSAASSSSGSSSSDSDSDSDSDSSSGDSDDVNTDEALSNGTLVTERNHYYHIAGDYVTLVTKKQPLVIRINPNWDGDIDLTPDKTL